LQKLEKIAPALKMVVMSLPPVMMSLIGLAALSRKKGGQATAAGKPAAPAAVARRSARS
jgi:hypothetical protein